MNPTDVIAVALLVVIAAIAVRGIRALGKTLPPRPEHERADDLDLASGSYMRFRRLP